MVASQIQYAPVVRARVQDEWVFFFVFIYAPLERHGAGEEPRFHQARSGGGEDAPCVVLLSLSLSSDTCCFWRREGGLNDFTVSSHYREVGSNESNT